MRKFLLGFLVFALFAAQRSWAEQELNCFTLLPFHVGRLRN